MTTPDAPPAADPDMTAGELALGVLDGEERAAALRRVLADPAFAHAVEQWRTRFATLYAAWPEEEPGAEMARRVAGIPDGGAVRGPGDAGGPWRWVAAASSLAAAVLLGVLVLRPEPPAPGPAPAPVFRTAPTLIAVLKPEQGEPFGAVFDPRTREVRFAGTVATAADRDAELWAIGGDGVPHAAGLLPHGTGAGTPARLVLARALTVAAGTTLAISVEPVGGSPGPTPTGPVVAAGTLAAI